MPIFENFISYRRKETLLEVKNIYDALKNRGYSVFCDVYTLDNGNFDENLIKCVKGCTNYILVINNHSLDRCADPDDWLLKEIRLALENDKNVVIVFVGEVDFKNLPQEVDGLRFKNALKFDIIYFDSFINELTRRFLVSGDEWGTSSEADFVIEGDRLVKYKGTAVKVSVPEYIKTIGEAAFKDVTFLKEINLNEGLLKIEASAFERCLSLSHIEFPSTLTELGERAFARCYGLLNVDTNDGLVEIGRECFAFCSQIKLFSLPAALKICSGNAFNECNNLSQFIVRKGNESFCAEDGMLYNADLSALIRCPTNYKNECPIVPESVSEIADYAFFNCDLLKDIVLPAGLKKIGEYAFAECRNIMRLKLPSFLDEIAPTAFCDWTDEQDINAENVLNESVRKTVSESRKRERVQSGVNGISEYVFVKTTFESEQEAKAMAKGLLEKHLIVSGQLSSIRSMYSWEEKICDEKEFELSCITRGDRYPEVEDYIRQHHSYELCELLVVPIIHTPDGFGKWIDDYVADGGIKEKKR